MLQQVVELFARLPDTLKAVIIASVVTFVGTSVAALVALIGVLVTNRGHEKRFRRQLEHDQEQKRLEREMSLRKEVYLDAAEAIMSSLAALGRLADVAVPQDELAKQFSEMTGALAKVHIIGSSATLSAVSIFSTELTSAVLDLSLARYPLLQKQAQLKIMEDQTQSSAEQSKIRSEFENEWLAYVQRCYETSTRLSQFLVPAMRSVREELDLPFDAEAYERLVEASLHRQNQAMREFLRRVQEQQRRTTR